MIAISRIIEYQIRYIKLGKQVWRDYLEMDQGPMPKLPKVSRTESPKR